MTAEEMFREAVKLQMIEKAAARPELVKHEQ